MPFITWKVYVDFDVDGSFATSGDDITAHVMDMSFSNGMSAPYQLTSDEAELTMRLSNDDKRFSPEYSSGTYYGKLLPQRPVKVDAIYNGSTATMYRGWVDTWSPDPFRTGSQYTLVRAIGAKQTLQDSEVYLSLMQNVTADQVLAAILGQVATPPVGTAGLWRLGVVGASEIGVTNTLGTITDIVSFETGVTTFAYVGDSWENGISANDAIERVMRAERGRFFYSRAGSAIFYNHQHYVNHTANDGTVNNTMVSGVYDYGEEFYPIVRVNCSPRTISSGTADVLWTLENPVTVPSNGTATIRARYADSSGADISGLNIAGTPTFTADSSLITLYSFSAQARSAEAVFVNSGAKGSVTAMSITGKKLTQFNQIEVEASDGSVAGLYGRRTLAIDASLLDSTDDANDVAYYELGRRKMPKGMFKSISMQEKGSTALASQMFNFTMGTRLRVQETQTGHDHDYFIMGEQWQVSDALKNSMVTWILERTDDTAGWLLGVTGRGELGSATYLGF